jgi:hypothetical protein
MRNAPKVTCAARAISAPFEQDPRVSQGIFELIDAQMHKRAGQVALFREADGRQVDRTSDRDSVSARQEGIRQVYDRDV